MDQKYERIIRKRCWNCQQSIAHLRIGNWEFCSLQDRIHHSLIFMNIISGVGIPLQKWRTLWIQRTHARSPLEVKHGPKSLINIISTFEMKMTLSEVSDVVLKDLQEVLVQGQVSAKDEGPWRDVPPVKSFLQIRFSNTVLRWDISYCCTLLKHKSFTWNTAK